MANHWSSNVDSHERSGRVIDAESVDELTVLAWTEIEEGDPARAVELCERLIEFYAATEGADAQSTMTWRGFLGRALNGACLHDRAEAVLRQLVADRTRVLGADDPATFVARGNLNRAIGFSGRTSEALDASYELLADRERVLGADNQDTLRSRGTICRLRLLRGERAEALSDLQALYTDRVRVLGVDHPDTIENHFNVMVGVAAHTHDLRELDELIAEVVDCYGDEDHATFIFRSYRPALLDELGFTDEADSETEMLYADQVRVLGELHPSTLTTGLALARRRWDRGDHTVAGKMQAALVRVITATLGKQHPLALSARTDLLVMQADELTDDEYLLACEELVDEANEVYDEASPGWNRIASLCPELFEEEGEAPGADS